MTDAFARAALAGAMDLTALKAKAQAKAQVPATPAQAAPDSAPAPAANSDANGIPVTSIVIRAGVENLRELLGLSDQLPILVDFQTEAITGSASMSALLERLVIALDGRVILAQVNSDQNPQILDAFQLRQGGVAVALLRQQPVPLISADLDEAEIQARLDRLVEIAVAQGMTAKAVVSADAPSPAAAAALPPRHERAFELIDAGDYDGAIAEYETALREMPTDSLAVAGLAQVKLLKRVHGVDVAAALAAEPLVSDSNPAALNATLLKADACLASGHAEYGCGLLLDRFAEQFAERDALRTRLLEFFTVLGAQDPIVVAARKRLTALMY